MRRLIYIVFMFAWITTSGQYVATYNGQIVKLPGGGVFRHHTNPNPNPDPPPGPYSGSVNYYLYNDFEDVALGEYDSLDMNVDWGTTWVNTYKTDAHDSTYIEYFPNNSGTESSNVWTVWYFDNNKGTYPDMTCNTGELAIIYPNFHVDGSGVTFEFPLNDSIDPGKESDDIWYFFMAYIDIDDYRMGGKFGFTCLFGSHHATEGATAPDSTEGFSHIFMWTDPNDPEDAVSLVKSYMFYQISPYGGGGYAQSHPWCSIDGVTGDSAIIPKGEWFSIAVHFIPNTFTGSVANSDGVVEGFMNGKMYFRKSNIMMIHGAYEIAWGSEAEWYIGEAATFFGGCNTGHVSVDDEIFRYDNIGYGEFTGENFPDGDTVSRSLQMNMEWMYQEAPAQE